MNSSNEESSNAFEFDTVQVSVDAYTDHVQDYIDRTEDLMGAEVAEFVALLPVNAHVLDAGCGPGRDLERFVAAGLHATGVDLNEAFVECASVFAPAYVADLRALNLPDALYDGVWASASLVHLSPKDAAVAVKELYRVLVADGVGYFSVKDQHANLVDNRHGVRYFTAWNRGDFANVLLEAGFEIDSADSAKGFHNFWVTKK